MSNALVYLGLKKRKEFLRVQGGGQRFRRRHFVMLVLANGSEDARVGFTVSRRVGNAVVRNRVRRRLREALRHNSEYLCAGFDYVIIAFPRAAQMEFGVLCREVTSLLKETRGQASRSDS